MKDVLILGQNIQGLIAAGLLAALGDDVSVIEFQNEPFTNVAHIPFAIPNHIIQRLELEKYGLEIPETPVNPFKKLPFYSGLTKLINTFNSLEDGRPAYNEKSWRDAWNIFELSRILSDCDSDIQSLFSQIGSASLIELLDVAQLSEQDKTEIVAHCILGAKTDPYVQGSAASILPAMMVFEQKDCVVFQGHIENLVEALTQSAAANNVKFHTDNGIQSIDTHNNAIEKITTVNGDELSANHYVLDYDPVWLFRDYLMDYKIAPAFKNRIFPKQNLKECVHIRADISLGGGISAPSMQYIKIARHDMKNTGVSSHPMVSIVGNDIIAQYFDADADDGQIVSAVRDVIIKNNPDINHGDLNLKLLPMATQFGQPTFVGAMPLLQLIKVISGYHSIGYDLPLRNLLIAGYGQGAASHYHTHEGGIRVANLLQSL